MLIYLAKAIYLLIIFERNYSKWLKLKPSTKRWLILELLFEFKYLFETQFKTIFKSIKSTTSKNSWILVIFLS